MAKILKQKQEEAVKNKNKVKQLEQDQKGKEIETFKNKLVEIERKRSKDYEAKKENVHKILKLGETDDISCIRKLVNDFSTLPPADQMPGQILNILSTDKQRTSVQKLIDKIKTVFKAEDAGDIKKKTDEQMSKFFFTCVKQYEEQHLPTEYEQTVFTLCTMYSKTCLTSIITYADLDQILPALLKDKNNQKLFSCFIKSQFNEALSFMLSSGSKDKLKAFQTMLRKLLVECAAHESDYGDFLKNFFYYDIIESGINTIKEFQETAPGKVLDYFNTEEKILR